MTTRIAPEGAGRYDSLHGDEDDCPELTPAEQAQIEARADELMRERLADRDQFCELLAGIEPAEIEHPLFRALQNLDNACSGDRIGINAVLTALCQIQRTIYVEAVRVWRDECERQAEREIAR